MVIITINGKKQDREFQNMAQALAFAYQYGECYAAEKVEIISTAGKTKPDKTSPGTDKKPGGGSDTKEIDNTDIPLEKMNKEQLLSYALDAKIDVNYTATKEEILTVILAAKKTK